MSKIDIIINSKNNNIKRLFDGIDNLRIINGTVGKYRNVTILVFDDIDELSKAENNEFLCKILVIDSSNISIEAFGDKLDSVDYVLDTNINEKILLKEVRGMINCIANKFEAWKYKYFLQTVIDSSPDMVWFKDEVGRHIVLNETFGKIVNKPIDFCLNKEHPDIWDIPWDEYESSDFACRKSEEEVIRSGQTGLFEEKVLTGGRMKQFMTYKSPLFDTFGNIMGTCGIGHDCTDFSNIGLQIEVLIQSIPFPMFICDEQYNVIRMNTSAEAMTYGKSENINYLDWKNRSLFKVENAGNKTTYSSYSPTGKMYLEVIEQEVRDYFGNVNGHICMLRDITYRMMYEELMLKAANTDELTGMYNRRYFYDFISNNKNKEMYIIYMDLDHFKDINDNFGHARGDEVLKKTANTIMKTFSNGINARIGGDEFATIIASGESIEELDNKCRQLQIDIKHLVRDADEIGFGLSAGIAKTCGGKNADDIIREADKVMYEVKNKHHNELAV